MDRAPHLHARRGSAQLTTLVAVLALACSKQASSGGAGGQGAQGGGSAGRPGLQAGGAGGGGGAAFCEAVPAAGSGLIVNGSFDDGTTGWFGFGGATLAAVSNPACGGLAAAVTGRTQTYHGPAQSLIGRVAAGETIGLSAWVRVAGAPSAALKMTLKTTAGGQSTYAQIAAATAIDTAWTRLSGSAVANWTGELTELTAYVEGAPAGVDIFVDNVYGSKRGPVGGTGTGNQDGSVTVEISLSDRHQTLEGFGASLAWYQEMLVAHAKKTELYGLLFKDLGLDVLRFRNRFGRTGESSSLAPEMEVLDAATASLGHAPKLLLTSWSPPAAIKANNDDDCSSADTAAKTCTLRKVNGQFDYAGFADYWAGSLDAYAAAGIRPTWISIQNEPDFSPTGWEGCVFDPTETAAYPGYDRALAAVDARLAGGTQRPAMLGPETLGIHYGKVQGYLAALDTRLIAGIAHHIYELGNDGIWDWKTPGPDSFADEMFGVQLAAGGKPTFQTEFNTDDDGGNTGGFETAWLVHNALVEESASAFLYWELVWPPVAGVDKGLVTLDGATYRVRDQYYSMKHFAYYTDPGYVRVGATSNLPDIRASAFRSPDDKRLVVVLLNVGSKPTLVKIASGGFTATAAHVVISAYEAPGAMWMDAGALPAGGVNLPSRSVATVVFE